MERLTKEYTVLFNGVTDSIKDLEKTLMQLRELQKNAEELYITENTEVHLEVI